MRKTIFAAAVALMVLPAAAHAQTTSYVVGVPTIDAAGFGGCGTFQVAGQKFAVNTSTVPGASQWATVLTFALDGLQMRVNYNATTLVCNPMAPSTIVEALGVGNPAAF